MKKTQILIVEDEVIIAKDLQSMLRRLGYDVPLTVGTGEKAIAAAIANQPDLIVMDINLRGAIDGVQAATTISKQQDVPIVYLTANSDEATMQRAKVTDPFGFLIKPFEERTLHAGIEMALFKHRTEKETKSREQWLSTTLKSIADGVITTDARGGITFLNGAAEQLLGWTHAESIGRHYSEVFSVVDDTSQRAPVGAVVMRSAAGEKHSLITHSLLTTKSGEALHIEHSTAPIRSEDSEVAGYVVVFNDVSERRKLEAELRQVQKMDAIGKLAGSIAHDFNNALTAMMGYSSLLLEQIPPNDPKYADAGQILRAVEHSARLTRQLLVFSRKQMLHPTRMNLGETVDHVQGLLRRLIRENISLAISIPPELWPISADPGQCEQIVVNMAVNARDAMPNGGALHVDLENVSLTPDNLAGIRSARPGEFVALRFSDTGTGMSRETIDRIFEPFFTTKPADRGTGLGLSTCDRIVTQGGGFINVASVLGEGTVFTIYFPRSEAAELEEKALTNDESLARGGNETILVVEDEEAVRMLTARVLEDLGYTVIEAENGLLAMNVLESRPEGVDLIITDLMMPQMSGRDLAAHARAQTNSQQRKTRVLFMSGYTDEDIVGDPDFTSAVSFLQKPFTPDTLARTVRLALKGSAAAALPA